MRVLRPGRRHRTPTPGAGGLSTSGALAGCGEKRSLRRAGSGSFPASSSTSIIGGEPGFAALLMGQGEQIHHPAAGPCGRRGLRAARQRRGGRRPRGEQVVPRQTQFRQRHRLEPQRRAALCRWSTTRPRRPSGPVRHHRPRRRQGRATHPRCPLPCHRHGQRLRRMKNSPPTAGSPVTLQRLRYPLACRLPLSAVQGIMTVHLPPASCLGLLPRPSALPAFRLVSVLEMTPHPAYSSDTGSRRPCARRDPRGLELVVDHLPPF